MPVESIPLASHAHLAWRYKVDPSVFIFPPATLRVYTTIKKPSRDRPRTPTEPSRWT
ncbi:hypothetical protein H310_14640 [Aphanomyces invadans]|uniref:Uncharacterized protein n=1 Tax=Aphanomyces invadans TaxID=157072 RepID=A0A024T9C6_9STRA|nr:hypothetical protein H310_14640 [Aphanomyces invadans]ETV90604.1 hypothetical protein H310_14640 [Aphanomyces invadans]|eukprot:XP_008880757.1 hypothetical protein H310_14640 [Aphanomyces invadans]